MDEKREVLNDVRNLLEYAKSMGMTEVRMKQGTGNRERGTGNREQGTGCGGQKDRSRKPFDRLRVRQEAGSKIKPLDPASCVLPPASLPPALNSELRQTTDDNTSKASLEDVRAEIGDCKRCKLCKGRKNIVFGVGNPQARLMFIGEGPGADEDMQGIPFVGRAGQLLTKIIAAMGFKREEVYIANICKCRPPGNRNPEPDEVKACIPFLIKQAEAINPKVIVCLGSVATQNLLGTEAKITSLRGKFTEWQGIPVMPTYHPAFLLRNPNMKKPVWEDMQQVMKKLASEL